MKKLSALSGLLLVLGVNMSSLFAAGSAWEPGNTRCVPNFRNEKPVGYLCVAVDSRSEYGVIGMKKGDDVIEINGSLVFDPSFPGDAIERALNLWKEFEKGETGTLLVERGDSKVLLKKIANRK